LSLGHDGTHGARAVRGNSLDNIANHRRDAS
jgi:hypothetical protein